MRTIIRISEGEIRAILAKAFSQKENHIDIFRDADNQIIAEIEMGESDIRKEMQ